MAQSMSQFHKDLRKRLETVVMGGYPPDRHGDILEIQATLTSLNVRVTGKRAEETARTLREIHARLQTLEN